MSNKYAFITKNALRTAQKLLANSNKRDEIVRIKEEKFSEIYELFNTDKKK